MRRFYFVSANYKFTFHYVSIKTIKSVTLNSLLFRFTFHYVSIKTFSLLCRNYFQTYLHSTMYLLKRCTSVPGCVACIHLHSTMYLLKLYVLYMIKNVVLYLHSTMYLLKLSSSVSSYIKRSLFTFHYVSIKTRFFIGYLQNISYLHSTMYLLKLQAPIVLFTAASIYIPLCIY